MNCTMGFGPYTLLPPHKANSRTATKNAWTKYGATVAPDPEEFGSQGVNMSGSQGVNTGPCGVW